MSSDVPITTLRVALRAANSFAIELLIRQRGDRDFTDALILAALIQTNSAPLVGDVALQRRYGTIESPPPQELRRALSINAAASSLGLPFETVRRRVKRLVDDGFCVSTPNGVMLSEAVMASPDHHPAIASVYATVRSMYARLVRANCVQLMDLPPGGEPWDPHAGPPMRIVWRAAADYFLRMMELLLPEFPNLTRAFVLLEVFRANTDELSDAVRGGEDVDAHVPDEFRRPVRASDVAARLGLPHETVRRNLATLVDEGRCLRVREGFVVPAAVLVRANVGAVWAANFRNLSRMFGDLAETGVLGLWDAEAGRAGNAA